MPCHSSDCPLITCLIGFVISIFMLIVSLIEHIFWVGIFVWSLAGLLTSGLLIYLLMTKSENTYAKALEFENIDYNERKCSDRLGPATFKCLRICYYIFFGFLCFEFILRIFALSLRSGWRSDLNGQFPEACGAWAAKSGCTRVSLFADQCTR